MKGPEKGLLFNCHWRGIMENTKKANPAISSLESFQRLMNVMENDSTIEMSKLVNRIMRANPDKMPIFMEHTVALKRLFATSAEKRRQAVEYAKGMSNLTYIDPEKFEEARDLKLCLKRNFKELTFTTRSILEERKRILVEIKREDLKYINLSGNDRRIKRVLFDYKLGKGFVIAKELEPIFKTVDFAIWNNTKHKYETLYRYCKRYGVHLSENQICDRSLDESIYGWPIFPGSTLDNYLSITYLPGSGRYRSSDFTKGETFRGNIELSMTTFEARNIETDEHIHDFRYLTRRKNVYFKLPYEGEKSCDKRPQYVLKPIKESAKYR